MGEKTKRVVINGCYGGFSLSNAAYEKLIEWGVPVRAYIQPQRNPETGLWEDEPANEGEVIFDRLLNESPSELDKAMYQISDARYWDLWSDKNREHLLIIRVVEELGESASSGRSRLKIVEVPADVEYEIGEYDGNEWVAEKHRTWS